MDLEGALISGVLPRDIQGMTGVTAIREPTYAAGGELVLVSHPGETGCGTLCPGLVRREQNPRFLVWRTRVKEGTTGRLGDLANYRWGILRDVPLTLGVLAETRSRVLPSRSILENLSEGATLRRHDTVIIQDFLTVQFHKPVRHCAGRRATIRRVAHGGFRPTFSGSAIPGVPERGAVTNPIPGSDVIDLFF